MCTEELQRVSDLGQVQLYSDIPESSGFFLEKDAMDNLLALPLLDFYLEKAIQFI